MKKTFYILILLTILILSFAACTQTETSTEAVPTETAQETPMNNAQTEDQTVENSAPEAPKVEYEIIFQESAQGSNLTDIIVTNLATGENTIFSGINDIYRNHYHFAELHNGNLYIIKRVGYDGGDDDSWSDELWKYDKNGESTLIISSKGLDFRVSPDETRIALTSGDISVGEKLQIIDAQGTILKEFAINDFYSGDFSPIIGLIKWTGDGSAVWIKIGGPGPQPMVLSKIQMDAWLVYNYDMSNVDIGAEFDLNPNTGKLVYSDHPVFFDANSADEFKAGENPVTLYGYDLVSQATQEIAVSKAKMFAPAWLNDTVIEYNNPLGEGRATYIVE